MPSLFEVLVVNFDGTMRDHPTIARFVMRNHEEAMLCVGRKSLSQFVVPYAELGEAWLGLHTLTPYFNPQEIWLQGDSIVVVTWLTFSWEGKMNHSPWFQDIMMWRHSFSSFKVVDQVTDHALASDFFFHF